MAHYNESIVLVGGGGGVYRVTRFLKHIRPNIATMQTTFDRGGHSGTLRDERGILPPGDIRQGILALADDSIEPMLRQLLAHRFADIKNSSLNGATIGNILLTALTEITGSLPLAIQELCKWYKVKGVVLPVSLDHSDLCVELSDGSILGGEGNIDTRSTGDARTITRAFLKPSAHIYSGAREALVKADKIVFCPGDLYTSVIPNVLTEGFGEALKQSKAQMICVVNIMTKKSETHRYSASKFVSVLSTYSGIELFDAVICNKSAIPQKTLADYAKEHARPVRVDVDELKTMSRRVIVEELADIQNGIIRHNSRVASVIASL